MDTKVIEQLGQLLKAMGVNPFATLVSAFAISFGIVVIKGLHTLSVGSHSRRREFMEMQEKLCARSADALAWEIAVRHYFGAWIPAKVIERIRGLPSPGPRLVAASDLINLLEPNENDGTLAIKRQFDSTDKRKRQMALRFFLYVFLCFSAILVVIFPNGSQPLDTLIQMVAFVTCIGFSIFFLNSAADLNKLSNIVMRYPDLFAHDESQDGVDVAPRHSAAGASKSGVMSGLLHWIRGRLSINPVHAPKPVSTETPPRSSRPTSAERTPLE